MTQKKQIKKTLQGLGAFLFLAVLIFFSLKIIGSDELQQRIAGAGILQMPPPTLESRARSPTPWVAYRAVARK